MRRLGVIAALAACGPRHAAPRGCPGEDVPGAVDGGDLLARVVRVGADRLGGRDEPDDLVEVPRRARVRLERVRAIAVEPLTVMIDAARADGVGLWVSSGFRGYCRQRALHLGHDRGPRVAPPGASEHQLGTAVDLSAGAAEVVTADDPAYAWLDAEAWRYGFVNSYPPQDGEDPSDARTLRYTGTAVEPWHWRYVGDDAAARAHAVHEATGIRVSSTELIDLIGGRHDPGFADHDALVQAIDAP